MTAPGSTTDPTGRTFVSYRRSRLGEVQRLVQTLHELGVPTWQDVEDLPNRPTVQELERVLADPSTASAVLWLTPEVADSPTIRNIEAPRIVERERRGEGFFVVPVAAGGLDYDTAAALVRDRLGIHDLAEWNLERLRHDPATEPEIRSIAERVLRCRVRAVDNALPRTEPFRLRLMTWHPAAVEPGWGLSLDWHHHFAGRHADPAVFSSTLLPALRSVREALRREARARALEATGRPSLSAAYALGRAFLARDEFRLAWRQAAHEHPDQVWCLTEAPGRSPLEVTTQARRPDGTAIAVLLSVSDDVESCFGASSGDFPAFSAVVRARPPGSSSCRHHIASPGEAVAIADAVIGEIRSARNRYPCDEIYLFASIPAGLAILLGQLSNTLGTVRVYEHDESTGRYRLGAVVPAEGSV